MKELKYLDITKTAQGHIKVPSVEGMYPDMGAGRAEAIVTNIHDTDLVPYVFRKTPYRSTRETDKLVGASVAWKQIAKGTSFSSSTLTLGLTITASSADDSITVNGTASSTNNLYFWNSMTTISNHIYFFQGAHNHGGNSGLQVPVGTGVFVKDTGNGAIFKNPSSAQMQFFFTSGDSFSNEKFYPQLFDLTLALGSTIADYIYTLESGTAGAGIAKLREWGFFDKPYYAYNAGGIESVNVSKHRMVGLNQWDEEWEAGGINNTTGADEPNSVNIRGTSYCACLPSTDYFVTYPFRIYWYDANKTFISSPSVQSPYIYTSPSNAAYFRIRSTQSYGTTYNNDICVNISNAAVNRTYEPYTVHEYPLADITLRGILKLDGSNNLYADGDVYEADGTVTRKYAERAYQAGDESLADAITDGTTTVYKLTTPTTETADPYTEVQVCSPDGTEEYVDRAVAAGTRDVSIPCGHETEYAKDIVGAIEGIPFPPTTNGNYKLRVSVASGVPTYSWVSE